MANSETFATLRKHISIHVIKCMKIEFSQNEEEERRMICIAFETGIKRNNIARVCANYSELVASG